MLFFSINIENTLIRILKDSYKDLKIFKLKFYQNFWQEYQDYSKILPRIFAEFFQILINKQIKNIIRN